VADGKERNCPGLEREDKKGGKRGRRREKKPGTVPGFSTGGVIKRRKITFMGRKNL